MPKIRVRFLAVLAIALTGVIGTATAQECFQGTRAQARAEAQQRLGFLCQGFCKGCGCKRGPGFRKPDGDCATKSDIARGVCGEGPEYAKCKRECAPLLQGCVRGPLPTPDAPTIKVDDGIDLYEITGEDKHGRRAAFDIIMISEGLSWKYQENEIERNEPGSNEAGKKKVSAADLRALFKERFADASDIIASGTASAEGKRTREENRARKRGESLAKMIRESTLPGSKVWMLNLGQFLKVCKDCTAEQTANQRPVFVAGAVSKEEGVNLSEALRMALRRRKDLPDPSNYSLFDLIQHR
ncbi:MAG: hypothetical protein ABL901_04475 [Hyphomicrobiaceae bacterium]